MLLLLTVLLTACSKPPAPTEGTEAPTTTFTEEATLSTTATEETEAIPTETSDSGWNALCENLPIMDGSTSLIPLEAGIRAALFDKSLEEATADVIHSSTWGSFSNLLYGKADLIFSCPLSQEQWDTAKDNGVELEAVPIAMEGFVFVVNGENPVDSLTQQQLRDIYSGKITNWAEVGGLDEEIIPYQRNRDSGSQNYMISFMEGYELMDAPTENRPASMEGLMDVVAVNDNSRAAIGYSVYAYAADMYGNGDEIKFIQVDGVAPCKATMAAGTYPLLGKNYAVFRKDQPEDSYVRQLVDWILSYDGQLALAKAGYVTLENIGFDYEELTLSKYEGTGMGPAGKKNQNFSYKATYTEKSSYEAYPMEGLQIETGSIQKKQDTYRIIGLKDPQLTAEVHEFIDTQMTTWAWAESERIEDMVDRMNERESYAVYEPLIMDGHMSGELPVSIAVSGTNGYLSVAISVGYTYCVGGGEARYIRTETGTWDLLSGRRLSPEELFCSGVDIDQVLNAFLRKKSTELIPGLENYERSMKCDFSGLPMTGWHLSHDTIYFDQENPYFTYGTFFPLTELTGEVLSAGQLRDFADCLDAGAYCRKILNVPYTGRSYEYVVGGFASAALLDENTYDMGKKINDQVRKYIRDYFTSEYIHDYFAEHAPGCSVDIFGMDWGLQNIGNRYVKFECNPPFAYGESTGIVVPYPYNSFLIFDLTTGRQLSCEDLLVPHWEEKATISSEDQGEIDLSQGEVTDIDIWGHEVCCRIQLDSEDYLVTLPLDCLNLPQ